MTREPDTSPVLTDADAALLDKLVEANFDPASITGLDDEDRQRLDRIVDMLGLFDAYPSEPLGDEERETLVHATFARIDRFDDEASDRMRFSNAETGSGRSWFGASELVAVAAMLILGVSVIFILTKGMNRDAIQTSNNQNLAMIGQGLIDFASSNNDSLPTTPVDAYAKGFGGSPDRLDLQPLIDQGILKADCLTHPAHPELIRSGYSFQTQPTRHRFHLNASRPIILVGDSNPTVEHIEISLDPNSTPSQPRFHIRAEISWSPTVLMSDNHIESLSSHIYKGDDLCLPEMDWQDRKEPDVFLTH